MGNGARVAARAGGRRFKEEAMVATRDAVEYVFPPPHPPDAIEWPGTPLGLSNTITRTKSRTSVYDKTIDSAPGKREALLNSALQWMVDHPGQTTAFDVVIHGIRVRAYTNSPHLIDFWRDNWFSPNDWQAATGVPPPERPAVTVLAFGGVADQPEAAYYSRAANMVIFFNTSYYGQLKSWVLGAVGRVLADEYGIHSLHCAGVELDGQGVIYIAPTGTGKSTSSYGLMQYPNTRFHSDDWVYVRYLYQTRDGRLVGPREIATPDGSVVRGYRCFRWLDEHPGVDAPLVALTLDNQDLSLRTSDLDVAAGPRAYAYISEKVFYLRTNLVENFPEAGIDLAHAKLENVPDVTPAFLATHQRLLDDLTRLVLESRDEATRRYFSELGPDEARRILARLYAFDNARAMLDVTRAFGRERVFTNPLEPLHVSALFLLKRDPSDEVVLERLSLNRFMERLLIGNTPYGTREIAYNNYRATDDISEKRYIQALEARAAQEDRPLYEVMLAAPDVPETLWEEFELFRTMYQAAACYDLNTILQRDPAVRDKMEAVRLTMKLIVKALRARPPQACYTLSTYRQFIDE